MNPVKDFFQKLKREKKFKAAGPGHKLTENAKPPTSIPSTSVCTSRREFSEGAQKAGAAALARIEQKHTVNWSLQATKAQVRKELDMEKKAEGKLTSSKSEAGKDCCPALTVSGVYFTCPIIGSEVLPKEEIRERIRNFLREQLEIEKGLTACLIIHTLNENQEKVNLGVETLSRYLTNILDNPTEEKYQRIRVGNRIFQERIVPLEGAYDFLNAAGFLQVNEGDEEFFVFDCNMLSELEMLKDALLSAEPIRPILDRNLQVLKPSQDAQISLPDEFFNLSVSEIKREQESKTETVELMKQLRTKAMRERDQLRELHIYKYTLVRVRFPNGILLQGTFYVHEKLSAVREFILENLHDPSREFQLLLAGGQKLSESNSNSLLELKLVPAALINLIWLDSSSTDTFLKPEVMMLLTDL